MFGYQPPFSPQMTVDKINNQIKDLENLRSQLQSQLPPQPTNLTQNFQIAPNNGANGMKFVNGIQDVEKELVFSPTPFFDNAMSQMWVKDARGTIKSYTLAEVIEKDDKDLLIENLQAQIKYFL